MRNSKYDAVQILRPIVLFLIVSIVAFFFGLMIAQVTKSGMQSGEHWQWKGPILFCLGFGFSAGVVAMLVMWLVDHWDD